MTIKRAVVLVGFALAVAAGIKFGYGWGYSVGWRLGSRVMEIMHEGGLEP